MGQVRHDQLLESVREAIQEIASNMLMVKITPGEAEDYHFADPIDFVATIALGEGLRGGLCLAAPEKGALKLSASLLMESRQEMDDEMIDGFGELANMIAGGLQLRMEPTIGPVSIAPPICTYGIDVETSFDYRFECVSQYFAIEGFYFVVEIYFLDS